MGGDPQSGEDRPITATAAPRQRRMKAPEREELILDEAAAYFAECGLAAGTIQLARRLHITQPLLYRYFPSKEVLIARVYDRQIEAVRRPDWNSHLEDPSRSMPDRLKGLYRDYHRVILTREHVRLFLFSGLANGAVNARYFAMLSERILRPIVAALRKDHAPHRMGMPVGPKELELAQSLHGAVYQIAFRQYVHDERIADPGALIDLKVDFFLDGARRAFAGLAAPGAGPTGSPARGSRSVPASGGSE